MASASTVDGASASSSPPPEDQTPKLPQYINPDTSINEWTPETALQTLPSRPQTNSTSPLPFLHLLTRLKSTKRSGWIRSGIPDPESLADHMYRMSIMTMLLPSTLRGKVDTSRCTAIALVHDMAECLVGDITPRDGVTKSEKARRELAVMNFIAEDMLGNYDDGQPGEKFLELFLEYEHQETLEAKVVKDIDKLELLVQRLDYERLHAGEKDLSTYSWVMERIELPEMRVWCDELQAEREELWRSWGKVPVPSPKPAGG